MRNEERGKGLVRISRKQGRFELMRPSVIKLSERHINIGGYPWVRRACGISSQCVMELRAMGMCNLAKWTYPEHFGGSFSLN